jgi:predicted MFS family arabinose efflux permease
VRRPDLGALRHREFALLFAARVVSLAGSAMAPVALAFAVLDLGGSATDLGLVLTAAMAARVLFILVGGVVADRVSRSVVMVGSNVVSGAAQLALGALLVAGTAEIWAVAAFAVLASAASSFFFPASQAIVPQTVPVQDLQGANALLRLALNATNVGGAAAGGVLVATVGAGWAIAFDGITYLAAAAILLRMRVVGSRAAPASFVRELAAGWVAFRSRTWLWVVVVGFGFTNAASASAFGVLGPVVAKDSFGGARAWGVVLAAQAAGFIVGSVVALRLRPARPLLVGVAVMTMTALPLVLLALGGPLPALLLATLLAGVAIDLFTVLWDTSLQGHVPLDVLSRVSAWDALGSWVLMPIGFALVGPTADAIGVGPTLWLAAGIVVAGMLVQLAVGSVRRLPRPDHTAPEL